MQILPAYAEDLVMEESSVRIKALKLLGAVFSVMPVQLCIRSLYSSFMVMSELSVDLRSESATGRKFQSRFQQRIR